jgi:anaerobic magnesium-protoporphyrin IX monomethyl ester cyclase
MTSRGCPGQCTYCCTKQLFGLRYRTRSVNNIVEEIEFVIKKFGAREIHIWDDNFAVNKKQLLEFCKKIKEKGIHKKVVFAVPQGLRVDQVDEEILRALKSINVYSVGFGVESGNQKILDLCKKGTTLEQSRRAIKMAKKIGLEVWAFFIFGLYGDTEETMRQTIDFAKELDPDFAKFLILKPFPGTEIFEQLDKCGLILERDYNKYGLYEKPIHNLPKASREKILEMQNIAFREFYMRPTKIIKQFLRIRSFYGLNVFLNTGFSVLKLNISNKKK